MDADLLPGLLVCGGVAAGVVLALVAGVLALGRERDGGRAPEPARRCPACARGVDPSTPLVSCSRCRALTHDACWRRDGACRSVECAGGPEISVLAERGPARPDPEHRCPYCHGPLEDGASGGIAPCSGCGTRYHGDCLRDHGCAVIGCDRKRPGRARARG